VDIYFILENKYLKGTVVNRALPSMHGGPLEIMLKVPLKCYRFFTLALNPAVRSGVGDDWDYPYPPDGSP